MAKLNVVVPAVDVTIDGVKYTKVEREAAVGDVLRMIGGPDYITDGGFYEVTRIDRAGDPQITDDDGDAYDAYEDDFEVYAKVAEKPRRLTVGDYARVTDSGELSNYRNTGDIVKITEDDRSTVPFNVEHLDGRYAGWSYDTSLVRAPDAEVAAAKKALDPRSQFAAGDKVRLISGGGKVALQDYEDGGIYTVKNPISPFCDGELQLTGGGQIHGYAKPEQLAKVTAEEIAEVAEEKRWTAIGRKVNKFKAGDIVRVTNGYEEIQKGDIGVITHADGSRLPGVTVRGVQRYVAVELVTPVEQRFDR